MKLKEAILLFKNTNIKLRVRVRKHAFADYPERDFSVVEITELVESRKGNLSVNNSREAIKGTFQYTVKDSSEFRRECKLILLFNKENNELIVIVVSAFREI